MKVSSSFNQEFINFLKSVGGRWDPESRCWDVPDEYREQVIKRARELNVQNLKIEQETPAEQPEEIQIRKPQRTARRKRGEAPKEGAVRMRMSRDGRFVLISIDLLAFTEDIKEMFAGKRKSVRFRILPPRTK